VAALLVYVFSTRPALFIQVVVFLLVVLAIRRRNGRGVVDLSFTVRHRDTRGPRTLD
jgi:hypothetical protein